jgi:hypothetical protein
MPRRRSGGPPPLNPPVTWSVRRAAREAAFGREYTGDLVPQEEAAEKHLGIRIAGSLPGTDALQPPPIEHFANDVPVSVPLLLARSRWPVRIECSPTRIDGDQCVSPECALVAYENFLKTDVSPTGGPPSGRAKFL